MVNPEIRKRLLKKLDCTPQALSGRATRLKRMRPMTTDQAVYLIAHKEGIKIEKYLNENDVEKVGQLHDKIYGSNNKVSVAAGVSSKKTSKSIILKFNKKLIDKEPLLSSTQASDAKKMAEVFPLIYVLENSIRIFLAKAFEHYYGKEWWDEKAGNTPKRRVQERKDNEAKKPWHQKRARSNIGYLDLIELKTLANKIDSHLVADRILPKVQWLSNIIEEIYESRCVLCHMNPLKAESIQMIEVNYTKWINQISKTRSIIGL